MAPIYEFCTALLKMKQGRYQYEQGSSGLISMPTTQCYRKFDACRGSIG